MKTCSKCKIEKPFEDFGKEKRALDGKRSECKACVSEYNRSKKAKLAQKRYRSSEKGREKVRASDERYRTSEKGKATREAYLNREDVRLKVRNAKSKNKYARRSKVSDSWKASEVFESANWQCFYCGIDVELRQDPQTYQANEAHADHFIPLSNGGTNERKNIVCSCGQCNLRKNSKNPFEFIRDNINQ